MLAGSHNGQCEKQAKNQKAKQENNNTRSTRSNVTSSVTIK